MQESEAGVRFVRICKGHFRSYLGNEIPVVESRFQITRNLNNRITNVRGAHETTLP